MNRARTASRAFTLLEMIIVLAVLSLVVGIAAPRFASSASGAQSREAVRGLVDALTAQRAETIRAMRPSVVFVVGQRDRVSLVTTDAADATSTALESMLTERGGVSAPFRELGAWRGVALADPATGASAATARRVLQVRFDPLGRATAADGGIALVAPGDDDRIWRLEFDPISGAPSAGSGAGRPPNKAG